ncbi:hypothetical protein F4813DRAFT_224767 [Daldinia decipiens]|uniref:uncharacterized protein n=1 Tax=Daldinia decipiens TaxID=326647 RepID=UPI0020C40F19|nr:uncharacterized protein F4813DRAFT_224767 [Daldinia decipiens]KAI1661302.1 hypothetical protein F4813DRAFT_224767 [Daldinia decipiens]
MSLALASQCRRAANRHIGPQNDSIWIPEALLAAAFGRYCAKSRIIARHGSSVPGPMENRRRMGKRHMIELNPGNLRSASPPWGLENLADLTQWRWKPPSPPRSRLQRHRDESAQERTLARAMLNWFAEPSHDDIMPKEWVAEKSLPNITWGAQTTPTQVIDTGLNLIFRDLESEATAATRPKFPEFCRNWENYLAGGFYSGDVICAVLDGIQQGINTPRAGTGKPLERVSDRIKLDLLDATVSGLSSRRVQEHSSLDAFFWCDLLQRISELRINSVRVLTKAMGSIPEDYLNDISTGVLANLRTYLIASSRTWKRSAVIRQTNKIAEPLRRLNLANNLHILESGTQYVLMHRESTDVYFPRMRMGWLHLLARLPSVDGRYLIQAACILEAGKDTKPISGREICEMYLVRCRSSLKHQADMYNVFQGTRKKDSTYYGYLGMALWKTGQFDLARGLCEFLNQLGREQDIMNFAKGMRILAKSAATPLANIAIGMGNPVLAIEILSLYRESRAGGKRKTDSKNFWDTNLSTETLKVLIGNQPSSHNKVISSLRVKQLLEEQRQRQSQRPVKFTTRRKLLKATKAANKVAMAYAISQNISPRQSFAFISRCITYFQSRRGTVIPTIALRALLHNITRDLAEGNPGRVTRLRWFLSLLDKHVGRDKMMKIGLAMKQWREINARHRRSNNG